MNKIRVISLTALFVVIFSTNCFAREDTLKTHEINETIPIEKVQEYRENIKDEMIIDNVKYELQDIIEQENKNKIAEETERKKQKVVYTNNKYDVLNLLETKIEIVENGMSGILELQNSTLNIKINDSYKEQYKVVLIKRYENLPTNELINIPKTVYEKGITYYLVTPNWNISKVRQIEGQDIPIAYNGEMQYEGIKERTIIKSYLATVTYKGTLEKEEIDTVSFKISYKEVPQEIEEELNYIPIVATGTGIIFISGIFIWRRKRKNNKVGGLN